MRGLKKRFGATQLYDGFDIDIPRGKIVSVFGPNGCGKSTLINMMAGIQAIDAGEILFDGKTVRETRIGYVFQNYREALFPWKRAIDNIRYPLRFMKLSKAEMAARVDALVASFDVPIDLNRYPYEMSGGQQQLVSIMRALVVEPEVLFLDEPFSALDYEMTQFLRDQLQKVVWHAGHDHASGVARSRGGGVPRRLGAAPVASNPTRVADYRPRRIACPRTIDTL